MNDLSIAWKLENMDSVEVGTKQEMYELGALNLSPTLSYEEWENVGVALATMDGNIEWWIGDYFVFGEAAYGEKWAQATAKFGRPESTLQGYMYVASRFPQNLRRRNLPWWAHREVAALTYGEQSDHLAWVEDNEPTRAALRRRLRGETEKVSGGTCRVCQETLECEKCGTS